MERELCVYFIAHAGADAARAGELRDLLQPEVAVFLDRVDLRPGDAWAERLSGAQRETLATVALLSDKVGPAYYLHEEIANAIALSRKDPQAHRLIPVWLDGVPKDPMEIPYGVRSLHALDAAEIGMAGVAVELKRLAAELEGRPPPEPAPKPAASFDRVEVFDALCRLLPAMFDEVLFRVRAPVNQLAPATQPLSARAMDLVQWAEIGGREQETALVGAIRKVVPGVLG
jgi:hypothetical protein